jgi:SpoVK/Ycf46/Vps4 family AAA+-type ATPase
MESYDDVRLILAKLVRKYRARRPEFAERINQALRGANTRSLGSSVLRRATAPSAAAKEDVPIDADSRMSLVRIFDDRRGLPPPLLPPVLMKRVEALIRERRERDRLLAHGVTPTRSAILVGPPGVGKTLSARWIAAQIGKPLWVLDLTTVMSSLLGKTGNNLRMVFDHAREREAVLLLDEVDGIAKRRSDEADVGELKRLVTAILQEVDSWPDTGLLLAATNHPELVDPALWRRFDAVLTFDASDPKLIAAAVERFLGADAKAFGASVALIAAALHGASLSEVERVVATMRRSVLLDGVAPKQMALELAEQRTSQLGKADRLALAVEIARSDSLSHNQIKELTGVSRDTIRKHAGPSPIKGRGGRKDS